MEQNYEFLLHKNMNLKTKIFELVFISFYNISQS